MSQASAATYAGHDGRRFAGWRMLVIAFLAQNCALGLNFGIYGPLVAEIQAEFSTSRALASSGLSVMTLVMGLLSPVLGIAMRLVSLRTLMLVGAAINAVGHCAMTFADSIYAMLAIYALVIGPGVCMLGIIPSSALVSNWFVRGRGRALGFVNMPFFVFLFPMVSATVLQASGIDAVFLTVAAIFACLIPILLFVVGKPEDIGQRALGSDAAEASRGGEAPTAIMSSSEILRNPAFLVLSLGIGLVTAGGVMMVTHLVPLALDKGLDLQSASLLLSAFGVSGAVGALLFGWLGDRIGGARALAVQSFVWLLPWTGLLFAGAELPLLILLAALIGLCSGGIVGLCGFIMNEWLGPENFGRGMGYLYLLKVPFMFGAAPLAGYMFDRTGSYGASMLMHMATFVVVGLMFLIYSPAKRRAAPAGTPAAEGS